MTLYALINNKVIIEYPYDLQKLRKSVSLPQNPSVELLKEHNVVIVQETQKPDVDYTENITEGFPKYVKGKWHQTWNVSPATEEEILERTEFQSSVIKIRRNNLLAQSDWTQLPDVPNELSVGWAEYRTQLRKITEQPGFPWKIDWPTSPTGT